MSCKYSYKGSPVHISAIEQYVSDYYTNIYQPVLPAVSKGKVAIVGSGPAGITISFLLAKRGYEVTIFEANDQIGGILRYGIPEFRLPKTTLDRLQTMLLANNIKIRPNTMIGASLTIDDLFRDEYQAIFIGTGLWKPLKLGIKGESLGNVHFAIEYLRNPDVYQLGHKVLIIGAGNVAMDVARTALRHGSKYVTVLSHLGEEGITARHVEVEHAKIDGVQFEYQKNPIEFVDEGAILMNTAISYDTVGYPVATPIPETEQLFEADSIIVAISQGPRSVIVSSSIGIDINQKGLVITDELGRTTRPGVFASGDVVTGAKTVVEAVRVSKLVTAAIDTYIQ